MSSSFLFFPAICTQEMELLRQMSCTWSKYISTSCYSFQSMTDLHWGNTSSLVIILFLNHLTWVVPLGPSSLENHLIGIGNHLAWGPCHPGHAGGQLYAFPQLIKYLKNYSIESSYAWRESQWAVARTWVRYT